MFLQSVKCLRYDTLRYVTWGWKTGITSVVSSVSSLQQKLGSERIYQTFCPWSCSASWCLVECYWNKYQHCQKCCLARGLGKDFTFFLQ